VVGRAEF